VFSAIFYFARTSISGCSSKFHFISLYRILIPFLKLPYSNVGTAITLYNLNSASFLTFKVYSHVLLIG
jgi:hypothetical protein